jgi:hypothetical protein
LTGGATLAVLSSLLSPILGLLGLCGILISLAMALSPTFAALMVAFSIPLERIGRLTEDFDAYTISLSRIFGFLALGGFLFHAMLRRRRLRFGPAFFLYAGYTLIAALTVIYSDVPKDTTRDALRILGNLAFFFYVINAIRSFSLAKAVVVVWLLASIGTGIYAVYDYYVGQSVQVEEAQMGQMSNRLSSVVTDDSETRTLGVKIRRAFGTTSHPTLFGLNLTMTLPFFAFLIRTQSRRWKVAWFAGLVVVCFGIVLSNTRAVMLLAIATLVCCALRRLWKITPQTFFALALLGASILPFIPQDFYLRTLDPSLYTTSRSDSIRIRFKYWAKSYELIQEHWLTGIGVGDQDTIVKMVTDEAAGRITPGGLKASAHNEYIWTLVEVGLFGWLLHWGFVAWVIRASFKAAALLRRDAAGEEYWLMVACQITMVGILFFGLQTEVFHFPLKGWWLAAGLSTVMLRLAGRQAETLPAQSIAGEDQVNA